MSTTFGENIRKYRLLKGLTQEELALAIGYKTKGAVNKIENNVTKLPQNKIQACADALGVPVAKLFSDAEPVVPREQTLIIGFLPYLARADEATLDIVRKILDMPKREATSGLCTEVLNKG